MINFLFLMWKIRPKIPIIKQVYLTNQRYRRRKTGMFMAHRSTIVLLLAYPKSVADSTQAFTIIYTMCMYSL